MSYLDRGKEYEEKYLKQIKDDPENGAIFPCFSQSCYDEVLQARIAKRIDEAFDTDRRIFENGTYLGVLGLISVFGQYLSDAYGVLPEDIEFMCQLVSSGYVRVIDDTISKTINSIEAQDDPIPTGTRKKSSHGKIIMTDAWDHQNPGSGNSAPHKELKDKSRESPADQTNVTG